LRSAIFPPGQKLGKMGFVLFKLSFLRALPIFCLAAFFMFQGFVADRSPGEPPGSGDALTQAQIENQKAQARYYARESDRRGFWRSLREFGWPVGVVAVGIAAIIAVGLNQRANLRFRTDTEFYETIKRFSQKENSASRLVAAGVLAQIGVRRNRFYESAFDQLSLGLLSEPENHVREAIRLAMGRLVKKHPGKSLQKLEEMNRVLRTSVSESLYRFFIVRGGNPPGRVSENDWIDAERITEFDRPALNSLFNCLPKERVAQTIKSARKVDCTGGIEALDEEKAGRVLANAAEELRSNIKSISESLFYSDCGSPGFLGGIFRKTAYRSFSSTFLAGAEFRDLQSFCISRTVLRNANMASANLKRASLLEADLSNADLSHAKLSFVDCKGTRLTGAILKNADLSRAKIQNSDLSGVDLSGTIFRGTVIAPAALQGTKWWKADFRRQRNLLKVVYANLKAELPDLEHLYVQGEIHPSVLDFIGKVTEERL
jgi:pentapeptide repeat protein